jgi:hypothetical protein
LQLANGSPSAAGSVWQTQTGSRTNAELLWEAVDRRRLHFDAPITPGDVKATMRSVARALMAQFPQAEAEAAFHAELQAYFRTDPEMRAQQAAQQKAQFDEMARRLEAAFGEFVPTGALLSVKQTLSRHDRRTGRQFLHRARAIKVEL